MQFVGIDDFMLSDYCRRVAVIDTTEYGFIYWFIKKAYQLIAQSVF